MDAMSYDEWCAYKERFFRELPLWYRDAVQRRRRYHAYLSALADCGTAD